MSPSNLKKNFRSFLLSLAKCPNSLTWLPGHLGLSLSYFSASPSTLHAQCSSHIQLPSIPQTQYTSLFQGLHTLFSLCMHTVEHTILLHLENSYLSPGFQFRCSLWKPARIRPSKCSHRP